MAHVTNISVSIAMNTASIANMLSALIISRPKLGVEKCACLVTGKDKRKREHELYRLPVEI